MDIAFVTVSLAFVALAAGYVSVCGWLMKRGQP